MVRLHHVPLFKIQGIMLRASWTVCKTEPHGDRDSSIPPRSFLYLDFNKTQYKTRFNIYRMMLVKNYLKWISYFSVKDVLLKESSIISKEDILINVQKSGK